MKNWWSFLFEHKSEKSPFPVCKMWKIEKIDANFTNESDEKMMATPLKIMKNDHFADCKVDKTWKIDNNFTH